MQCFTSFLSEEAQSDPVESFQGVMRVSLYRPLGRARFYSKNEPRVALERVKQGKRYVPAFSGKNHNRKTKFFPRAIGTPSIPVNIGL